MLVLLLLPISQGHTRGWTSARTLALFAGAAVMTVIWVVIEHRSATPWSI
ncbi:hypothetical protein [Streptomyces mirabilis]